MSPNIHSYKWVHPVCGHETPLTNDPEFDLAVPDDMIAELNLPQAGMAMDMYKSSCHPANQKYLHESNPHAAHPPDKLFDIPAGQSFRYGGFDVTIDPMNAPMGNIHPFMNVGMDLDPARAIQAGLSFGDKREGGVDSMISLGWPSAHVECPACVREKLQREFDEQNMRMQQLDMNQQDWAPQARLLTQQLCKLQRAVSSSHISRSSASSGARGSFADIFKKQPMALVVNPTPHPEEPPLIRGPKAAEIIRNANGHLAQSQKPASSMHHGNTHANQGSVPANAMHNVFGRQNQATKHGNGMQHVDGRFSQSLNAANSMQNANGYSNQGPMQSMQHPLDNQFNVSSPANQFPSLPPPGGFYPQSSFNVNPQLGSQTAVSGGTVSSSAPFNQPSVHPRFASGPQISSRFNDRATGVNSNLARARVGELADTSVSTSPESVSTASNEVGVNVWATQDMITNAFEKVVTQQRQMQGDGAHGTAYPSNQASHAPVPTFNPMAQGFQSDRGLGPSGLFGPVAAKGNAGHRGQSGAKTQSPAQPASTPVGTRKNTAKPSTQSGNRPSGVSRSRRNTKAIPIVDPSTSQVKSIADPSGKTSTKGTTATKSKGPQNAHGEAKPLVRDDLDEVAGMPVTPNKPAKTSGTARAQYSKFKDNNSFSALSTSDDTDVEPGTPGGVKV